MSAREKESWIGQLWVTSLGSMLMLGLSIGDGALYAPTVLMWAWFVITLIAWLFRITYLAGTKR